MLALMKDMNGIRVLKARQRLMLLLNEKVREVGYMGLDFMLNKNIV